MRLKTILNILSQTAFLLLVMLMPWNDAMAQAKKFTLVIDAGHGGKDPGARGAISKEKDLNLKVALKFGSYVENNCPDVKVIYTRKTDKYLTLQERAAIANKSKADLFISIHTNAVAKGRTVRGFEVYTLGMHRAADNLDVAKRENSVITLESDYKSRYQDFDPNSSESYIMFEYMQDKNMENSVKLASHIQKQVCSLAGRVDKGVHQAGFLVLRETSMPSCLIELGFISTRQEERELNNAATQDKIARGIYNAFRKYRGQNPAASIESGIEKASSSAKTEVKKETPKAAPKVAPAPVSNPQPVVEAAPGIPPSFRIQIHVSDVPLRVGDKSFKGVGGVMGYQEGNKYKYTFGNSTDYNEIYKLRKQILHLFPDAFIIAFKGNNKVDVEQAIQEWIKNR